MRGTPHRQIPQGQLSLNNLTPDPAKSTFPFNTTPTTPQYAMDPFSAEGELLNIHNHFHQGQYQEVLDFPTGTLSPENALPARILQLRAQIALGQASDVAAELQGENGAEVQAVSALASLAAGEKELGLKKAEELAATESDNGTVQVLAGTVLQAGGKSEEALALLSQHQGNRMSLERNGRRNVG